MRTTLNTVVLIAGLLLLAGCKENDAWAMCHAAGYPKMLQTFDAEKHKMRFYCHRLVNATDEMKEIYP